MSMQNTPLRRCLAGFLTLGALSALSLHAGERVIFSNSSTRIEVPKEELDPRTVTPNSQGFDKDSSSVDSIVAPWQNPLSRSSNARTKKMLLKALDRQKNWMLQDPEELLDSSRASDDTDLDDIEFGTRRSRTGRGDKSSFGRYYDKQGNNDRYNFQKARWQRQNRQNSGREDLEDGKDANRPKDAFATRDHFEAHFESVFDSAEQLLSGPATGSQNQAQQVANQTAIADMQLEGLADATFQSLGSGSVTATPNSMEARAMEFDRMLNTTVADMTAPSAPSGLDGGALGGAAGVGPAINATIQPGLMDGMRSTLSSGLGAGAAMGTTGGAFGGGAVTSGGIFGSNPSPAQSIRNRPAVFDLPKRSF